MLVAGPANVKLSLFCVHIGTFHPAFPYYIGQHSSRPDRRSLWITTGLLDGDQKLKGKTEPSNDLLESEELSAEMLTSAVHDEDRRLLTILFHRYARLVRSVAYRILGAWPEADDVVQEVFLSVYGKLAEVDFSIPKARFWLVQAACDCAVARRRNLSSHDCAARDLECCLPIGPGPENGRVREVEEIELQTTGLQSVFQSLPDDQRRILELYFCQGYTLDQIAVELGRSRENVRRLYFRSLETLRKEMFSAHVQASV